MILFGYLFICIKLELSYKGISVMYFMSENHMSFLLSYFGGCLISWFNNKKMNKHNLHNSLSCSWSNVRFIIMQIFFYVLNLATLKEHSKFEITDVWWLFVVIKICTFVVVMKFLTIHWKYLLLHVY